MVKAISVIALSVAAAGAVGYFLTMGGGRPIGTDLSIIGQGKPALVLAYENFSPSGGGALNRLRKVRSDFDARLDFVVADLGTPEGRAFADRYQINDGQVVFLKQDGQALLVTGVPEDEQELRNRLESKLATVQPNVQ